MPSPTADFVNLQFPGSMTATAGEPTSLVYGRIYEAGVTEAAGGASSVTAQLGYGPAGSDPRTSTDWIWVPATFLFQSGNEDEYQASLTVGTAGTYAYTYRFGINNGVDPVVYTYADLNGAGNSLSFDPTQLGTLTVAWGENQEPAGGDENVAANEGGSYVFASGDFNFSDIDSGTFTAVVFTTLPATGALHYDNGVDPAYDLTAGAVVTVADIDAGYLSYVAPANSGGTMQTFTFQVRDNGGTADGGQDTDQSPNTMTIDIAEVNNAPTVSFTAPMSLAGDELAIGTEGYSYAQTPSVTALADGRYVVTWAVYPSDGTAGDSTRRS